MMFKDKTAIITGGAQGIGRAYAEGFARNGAKVVIADINIANAEILAAEINSRGGKALAVETDVSSEASVQQMVGKAASAFGTIDVLVNNAAIFSTIKMKPFDQISVDEWDAMFRVNTRGTFITCREVAQVMKRQRSGRIINTSSGVVDNGRPNYLHYLSSKAAINGMTRGLATELGEFNITVNTVSPYGIQTEVPRETITEAQWTSIVANQAIHVRITGEAVVDAVLFLASDGGALITGQTLHINGGTIFH
jgi:3-oxoacyl-[acyl-carrier protein] reductase